MRIVVLGGYGNFGARICRALAGDASAEVIAAGRDPDRGYREALLDRRIGKTRIDCADPGMALALRNLAPQIVIHCAGPFQGQDYRVAIASLDAGAHYIDLADGRDFVARFSKEVDSVARAAGLLAVSGASSVPALSSAVVDALAGRFNSVEEIQIAIAPAQRAPRGATTIKGVFSYAGKPFKWLTGDAWRAAYGWQELRRLQFAGCGTRWAAACDVPDLELFPARYPGVKTVEFRAALELGIQHFALWLVAQMRRCGIPVPLERWAGPLDRFASWLDRFGSERGGMLVSVTGAKTDGAKGCIQWHLTADSNHGPEIPCMPAILLARKLSRGEITARGASPCIGFLTLGDFAPEFALWNMQTYIKEM
ncbi:MAG TPA: saccharopine dehydrogenase NADP-binding domain-containing protein [Acidiferrobacterales bacterium]|nr:saccharopine dehydrogenase NADP-binding domain-containing protein [Acidiferrobacterales bacterium]